MTKRNLIVAISILASINAYTQTDWNHHFNLGPTNDIEHHDNYTYAANTAGLLVINHDNGEELLLNASNSNYAALGVNEIEVLDNGDLWLTDFDDSYQLHYYDGNTFTQHLSSLDFIRNLNLVDGTLWFTASEVDGSFADRQLYAYLNGNLTVHQDYADLEVQNITIDTEGSLWFLTNESLLKYNGTITTDQIDYPDANASYSRGAHLIDSDGRHWIHGRELNTGWIAVYDGSSWIENESELNLVSAFYETSAGAIGLYTANAYGNLGGTLDTITTVGYVRTPSDLRIIKVEANGDIWLNTGYDSLDYNLHRVRGETITTYGKKDDFLSSIIYEITQDCEGNIFCLSADRLQKYADDKWSSIYSDTKDPLCVFTNFIDNRHNCQTWLYGICNSVWEYQSGTLTETDILPERARSAHFLPNGNLMMSPNNIFSSSLIEIDTVGASTRYDYDSIGIFTLASHYLTTGETLVQTFGTVASINTYDYLLFKDGIFKIIDTNLAAAGEAFNFMMEDSKGNLWFAQNQLLHMYDGNTWTTRTVLDPFTNNEVEDMVEDTEGNFWLATTRQGIGYMTDSRVTFFNTKNSGILSNKCRELELTEDNRLWIHHTYGLSEINLENLEILSEDNINHDTNPVSFSLYPNPTQSSFTLSFPHIEQRQVEVFSSTGQLIYTKQVNDLNLEVSSITSSDFNKGCYWVRVSGASGRAVEKVVVH